MNSEITVAVLALLGSVMGTLAGVIVNAKLINYRIAQLESKVDKHNHVIDRVYDLEKKNAVIREYVTIHRSPFEDKVTRVGDGTLLMAFVHIGHDAQIGNYVTIANQTAVAGHVVIEDRAVLSAYVLIHQFCRIGKLAMIGGRTILPQDVPPYCMLAENCRVCGPNVIGMRRAGMSSDERLAIRKAIKTYFFKDLNGSNALAEIESEPMTPEVAHFVDFIRKSERGIMAGESELAGFMFDEE